MHLLFLTSLFPYTPGEEFLEDELPILADVFERITIVPIHLASREEKRPVAGNVCVRTDLTREAKRRHRALTHGFRQRVRQLRTLLTPSLLRESLHCFPCPPFSLLSYKEYASTLADTIADALHLSSIDVVYSFWCMQGALAAAILKRRSPHLTAVSRAHGFDLYPGRLGMLHLPFRSLTISGLDRVFTSSQIGMRFLQQEVPFCKERIETRYLGASNQEVPARPSMDGILRIVSCARVVPVKRLHLIVKTLQRVQRRVEWTHIGGGTGLQNLQNMATRLPPNITARFTGHIAHTDVLEFYRHHPVDVFYTVSRHEGLSVSLLEAFSFGIPAIATTVGGHVEIMGTHNGWLLPKNFNIDEAARIIDTLDLRDSGRRRAAEQTQREKFSASTNYRSFAEELRAGFRQI